MIMLYKVEVVAIIAVLLWIMVVIVAIVIVKQNQLLGNCVEQQQAQPVQVAPVEQKQVEQVQVAPEPVGKAFNRCGGVSDLILSDSLKVISDHDREREIKIDQVRIVMNSTSDQWGLASDEHSIRDGDSDGIVCESLFK